MKKLFTCSFLMLSAALLSQGFNSSALNFAVPDGGNITGSSLQGFNNTNGLITDNSDGSQAWGLMDMNGDGKKDLVVFAQNDSNGEDYVFGSTSSPHWRVYLNNGSQFNANSTTWNIPTGGKVTNQDYYGFNGMSGVAAPASSDGNQSWSLFDITGDRRPDLVVTAQADANGDVTVFGIGGTNHWKVYENNGNGFNSSPILFSLPQGGYNKGGFYYGFIGLSGNAAANSFDGNMTWSIQDMNGDEKVDLVVTAQNDVSGDDPVYGIGNSPFWKVFYNSGSGFSTNAAVWSVPNGGKKTSGNDYGYNAISGLASANAQDGNQTWSLMDLNGDKLPDLVVCAQNDSNGDDVVFGGGTPFWKVHFNKGFYFENNATVWAVPSIGKVKGSVNHGLNNVAHTPTSAEVQGSSQWAMIDLNGDGRLDIVSCAEVDGNLDQAIHGLNSNPFWKFYKNKGASFDANALVFAVPQGGFSNGSGSYGFNNIAGNATSSNQEGNQTWVVADINGDDQLDLIVPSERVSGGYVNVYNVGSNPHWRVYLNSATSSGLKAEEQNASWMVYPNPTQNQMYVKGLTSGTAYPYQLSDITGKVVQHGVLENDTAISLNALPNGVYMLQIEHKHFKVIFE